MSSLTTEPPPLMNSLSSAGFNSNSPSHSTIRNLSPSILIIILILAITIIVSVSMCLLLRQINRRCLDYLSTTAIATTSSASSSVSISSGRRVSPEQELHINTTTNTFSRAVIDSLPLFTFASITRRSSSTKIAADCAVCLSKFEPQDELRLLPLCGHAFHAHCIDTWLYSNQTCPLCRSVIFASESDLAKALLPSYGTEIRTGDSFRLEIGNVSRRQAVSDSAEAARRSYSIGSFEYLVDDESEVSFSNVHRRTVSDKEQNESSVASIPPENNLAAEVATGRSWLMDYVDRLSNSISSRAHSFRSSGRHFTSSSRRSELNITGEWDVEGNRVGEEIVEMFRWFSGV